MLHILDHPLIKHKLGNLRKRETSSRNFKMILNEIAGLLAYEITRDLPLRDRVIETPVTGCVAQELAVDVVLVPILRAGLGMVEGISDLIPEARIGHLGMARNEQTLKPEAYYEKLPADINGAVVMILDPMLATGGSASAAISSLKKEGARTIKMVSVVGSPMGVERIERDHPDIDIFLASLDEGLNEKGYIMPGLGDAGDRLFGTKII